jgi:hypothetical protein
MSDFKQLLKENQKQTEAVNRLAGITQQTKEEINQEGGETQSWLKKVFGGLNGMIPFMKGNSAKETENKREQGRLMQGLVKGITGLKSGITGFLGGLKDKVKKGMPSLSSVLMGAGAAALLAFIQSPYWDKTVKIFKEEVVPALEWLWENVLSPLADIIVTGLTWAWEGIKWAAEGISDGATWLYDNVLKPTWDFITEDIPAAFGKVLKWAEDVVQWFKDNLSWEGIKANWAGLTAWVQGKWDSITAWFEEKFTWAKEGIVGGWTSFTGWIQEKWDAVSGWFSEKFTWASEGIASGWTSLSDWVGGKVDTAITWIKGLFKDPVEMLDSLKATLLGEGGIVDLLFSPIDKAIAWIQGVFKWGDPENPFSLKKTITDAIDSAIEWIKLAFTDPKAAMQELWNGIVGEGGLVDLLTAPIDKAIAWVQGVFNWGDPEEPFKVSTFIKDVFKTVKDWFTGLWKWGDENGRDAKGDFDLVQLIKNAIDEIWNWFKGLLDIDVAAIAKSIPGGEALMNFLTTSDAEAQQDRLSDLEDLTNTVQGGTGIFNRSMEDELAEMRDLIAQENAYRLEQGSREMLQLGENGQVIVVPAPAAPASGGTGGGGPRTRTVPVGVVDGDSTTRAMVEGSF